MTKCAYRDWTYHSSYIHYRFKANVERAGIVPVVLRSIDIVAHGNILTKLFFNTFEFHRKTGTQLTASGRYRLIESRKTDTLVSLLVKTVVLISVHRQFQHNARSDSTCDIPLTSGKNRTSFNVERYKVRKMCIYGRVRS